ncbi:hypothetical protein ZOSMA_201G00170 [Zostera marina]|uniref:Uncharacterized protein n=1 Tax=Zostera marina TaxID=29655 RepID=A0A0K9PLX4_ZOSMR|nr:hypothetical protein ZOSMA_201G00170 [Zostera marina]
MASSLIYFWLFLLLLPVLQCSIFLHISEAEILKETSKKPTKKIITTNTTVTKNQAKLLSPKKARKNSTLIANEQPKNRTIPNLTPIPVPTVTAIELEDNGTADFISEFRDLPSRLHQTLIPDLEKMSTKSKAYITLANKEFTEKLKPIVGHKCASTMSTFTSATFIFIPITIVTLLLLQFRHHLSLQKILVYVHTYLAIYFATLAITSLVTRLEPLKFFQKTSPVAFLCIQVVQTLGYMLYLLLQIIDLSVVIRMAGLAQTIVSIAVGLHYYAAVFHHAILGQPPRTNWKIFTVYGVCFLALSVFTGAERRMGIKKNRFLKGC